jgi:hypothetical protein
MTKTQHDYAPHNGDSLEEGWAAVAEYVKDAVLIAFDECHKIYLAMDEQEAYFFRTTYQPAVVESIHSTPEGMLATLEEWFDDSCGLKFISAVWNDDLDPNAGFVTLISQCAGDDEDEDEDEE